MRRSHRFVVALAVASGALVACNLITGLNGDYSATAYDGAAVGDAAGGADAPGVDGQVGDGAMTDAMLTPDGGDGAVLSFCENAKGDSGSDDFFCTDFENDVVGSTGPLGWDSLVNNVGGAITLAPNAGVDGSHALDVMSDTADAGFYRQLKVTKLFSLGAGPDSFESFEVDFHFRVLASVVNYDAYGLLVFGTASPKENGIAGYASGPEHWISREGPIGAHIVNDALWHTARVVLVHSATGTPFNRTITLDGKTPIEDNTPNHVFDSSAAPMFSIGSFNTASSAGISHVQFDNVVVRRRAFP